MKFGNRSHQGDDITRGVDERWSPSLPVGHQPEWRNLGRWVDAAGTATPIRFGLLASSVAALALLLPEQAGVLAFLFPFLWVLFSIVLTPATVVLTSSVEAAGEDASFGFAMMNLAFAPGAIVGAVMAGVLRDLSGDLASMALVSAFCAGTVLLTARGLVPTSDVPIPRTDEA